MSERVRKEEREIMRERERERERERWMYKKTARCPIIPRRVSSHRSSPSNHKLFLASNEQQAIITPTDKVDIQILPKPQHPVLGKLCIKKKKKKKMQCQGRIDRWFRLWRARLSSRELYGGIGDV